MKVTAGQLWHWLESVPDPEIPVVSVVDLGIVREVEVLPGDAVRVTVTPTYSGCPATAVIADDIRVALAGHGIVDVDVRTVLSPPWTTDWLTERARTALQAYGIAPPAGEARCGAPSIPATVECPHCGSPATELLSRFGSTPCKAQFRCQTCLEPFDYFKCL